MSWLRVCGSFLLHNPSDVYWRTSTSIARLTPGGKLMRLQGKTLSPGHIVLASAEHIGEIHAIQAHLFNLSEESAMAILIAASSIRECLLAVKVSVFPSAPPLAIYPPILSARSAVGSIHRFSSCNIDRRALSEARLRLPAVSALSRSRFADPSVADATH
jgi:hypothetical protein